LSVIKTPHSISLSISLAGTHLFTKQFNKTLWNAYKEKRLQKWMSYASSPKELSYNGRQDSVRRFDSFLAIVLPGLASNHYSPHLYLWSSWDYRSGPLSLASILLTILTSMILYRAITVSSLDYLIKSSIYVAKLVSL
jgi:hypothetical protein